MKYISLPIFIVSLAIGLLIGYILGPEMKVVYLYPTPSHAGKTQYEDNAGNCFVYRANPVSCPANEEDIKKIPVQ